MGEETFNIDEVFESAVTIVKNLPKEGPVKPSDGLKLKLYAYFKQATHGPNDTPKPRFYQLVESYKWDAWQKLGDMSKEDAMSNYIRELKQIMDTIPKDDLIADDNKHFEDILGKKFYDYWFAAWNNSESRELIGLSKEDLLTSTSLGTSQTILSRHLTSETITIPKAHDNHSSSSDNSSMSMLEDTHSPCGDGFKTPNSLEQCNITSEMSDQFALAVLRLQHNLDDTNTRLQQIEQQLTESIQKIRSLENQTLPKQTTDQGCSYNTARPRYVNNELINYILRMCKLHWFYLCYPIIVYALLRAFENRRRNLTK